MTLSTVFGKTLRDQRRSLIGWLIGTALLITYVVAFWPVAERSLGELSQVVESMPEAFRAMMGEPDFGTAQGYLSTQLFAFMLPVLTVVLAIGKGAAVVAGEEERGELELLLARPLPRARIALEKAAGVLVAVAVVVAGAFTVAMAGILVTGMDVRVGDLAGGMLGLGLLGWLLAGVAYAVGAATGRRGLAVAAASVVALLAYLAATFAPMVDGLAWLADASPWRWAFGGDPLGEGPSPPSILALLAATAAAIALGTWRFSRRDVAV